MTVQVRHMREDQQLINGLTAYILGTFQSDIAKSGFVAYSSLKTGYWGIRVWKRSVDETETEITAGTPVAQVSRSATGAGLQSATWNCPSTALASTDAIVVRVYVKVDTIINWILVATFITERLGAQSLDAVTWTVYYYTVITYVSPVYRYYFYWGTTTYDSRIENFRWTPYGAPPIVVELSDALVGEVSVGKVSLKQFADAGLSLDYARRGIVRSAWDYPYVHEYLFRRVDLFRVLVDSAVGLDSLSYYVGKAFYVTLADYCVGEFVGARDVLTVRRETPLVAERLAKCMVRSVLDSTVLAEWVSTLGGRLVVLFDVFVGEHVPARGVGKVGVDALAGLDWIVKSTVCSLADVGLLAEYFSSLAGKLVVLRDFLVGEHVPVKDVGKVSLELLAVGDWKFLDVSKALVDAVSVAERFFAGRVVELFDRVMSDFEVSFGRGFSVKERAKMEELVTKLGYTLMGEEVWRRVYHRVWYDLIEVADQNTKIVIAQALIDAFKSLYNKLKE